MGPVALSVVVDGEPMAEADARAFWQRFSDHMEAHQGDLAGFAKAEGFASVKPVMTSRGPELVVSRTGAQTPYAKAPFRDGSFGSERSGSPPPRPGAPNRSKKRGKPARS